MAEANFYLKKAEESTGLSLIYLQFKYKGNRLVFSFGQSVDPNNWNANKQRVKNNKQTTADGDHNLNDLLHNLKEVCEKAYKDELKTGIPTPKKLREYLIRFMNQNSDQEKKEGPDLFELLERFIAGEIRRKGKVMAPGTTHNYHSLKLHLRAFETEKRYKINFDTINLDFFDRYVSFLEKKDPPLAINSISKSIRLLKSVMNKAVSLGYTRNVDFRHEDFNVSEEETDAVYLSDSEIVKLYRHDFSENKKLDRERDRLVYGCFVGLRFSDYSVVKPENIVSIEGETFIKMIAKKTGELVIIPCNPIVLEIFKKYGGPPPIVSNQKFNIWVKDVCKDAGLIEKGRLATSPEKPLYECVSSHTCRRSFATNLYLDNFPVIDIMKITGHKTEKAFMKYIRVSKLDSAKRLSKHQKANWSQKILQVEKAA
jgi:integrase